MYGYVDRGNLPELMQQFDFSDPDMPNSRRASTVVPQQALFFMNNSLVVDVARKMVARKEFTAAGDEQRVVVAEHKRQHLANHEQRALYRLALGFGSVSEFSCKHANRDFVRLAGDGQRPRPLGGRRIRRR